MRRTVIHVGCGPAVIGWCAVYFSATETYTLSYHAGGVDEVES